MLRRLDASALSILPVVSRSVDGDRTMSDSPLKTSGKDMVKSLAWFLGAVGLIFALIHYAPIISHGGF
jgi:hypothetical protein